MNFIPVFCHHIAILEEGLFASVVTLQRSTIAVVQDHVFLDFVLCEWQTAHCEINNYKLTKLVHFEAVVLQHICGAKVHFGATVGAFER